MSSSPVVLAGDAPALIDAEKVNTANTTDDPNLQNQPTNPVVTLPEAPPVGGSNGNVTAVNGESGPAVEKPPRKRTADDAARYFCKDVFMPQSSETAIHQAKSDIDGTKLSAVMTQSSKLWDRGRKTINYGFLPGDYAGTEGQHKKVRISIDEWEKYGAIYFQEVGADNMVGGNQIVADVRISFDPSPSEGSWSLVGTDCLQAAPTQATMNLGWLDPNTDTPTRSEKAVIMHEFGHVLGMLHEHQSPAGGGIALKNVDAAIKFYGVKEGWAPETVRKQVIKTYNENDVSSFSQVDRKSIMQYPMPASVTGLSYDIDYNYVLSDMDKAYIGIMYPKTTPETDPTLWTLDYALEVSGITREDPYAAVVIKNAATVDSEGAIDLAKIRDVFSSWAVKAHIDHSVPEMARGPKPANQTIRTLPIDMCGTDEPDSSVAKAPQNGAAHAVIDPEWLPRVDIDITEDGNKNYSRKITWATVPCPKSKKEKATLVPASEFQELLITQALKAWDTCASIEFEKNPDPAKADLIFTFQKYHWALGTPILKTDSRNRSYCRFATSTPPEEDYNPKVSNSEFLSGRPQVKHTICYRGVSETVGESDLFAETVFRTDGDKNYIKNIELDLRTVRHEVGHYLGLSHENVGLYGYCLFDAKVDLIGVNEAKKLNATKFDTGSIMDSLRVPAIIKDYVKTNDNRALIRTVYDLSTYDIANVSLLHPGKKLNKRLIGEYGFELGLPADVINTLGGLADAAKWHDFRKAYLAALKMQNDEWSALAGTMTASIEKHAREDPSFILKQPTVLRGTSPEKSRAEQPPAEKESKTLLEILYEALAKTIGPTGSQILSLQFPTRYLAKEEFQFELSGIYSNFVKPVVVSEAEFRLTDALYDAAAIVGAPNGRSLSTVYNQLLNNFVPKYSEGDRKVREERERVRSWLLTEISDQNNYFKFDYNTAGGGLGNDEGALRALNEQLPQNQNMVRRMTRMEFANQLSQESYDAQQTWELNRDDMIAEAIDTKDPKKLAAVTRKLVHTTRSQQGKLAMKHADAVVRGYSHIVREALGHLDVATTAESLQDAKDALRTSAVSSLYGASQVYPVLMSPVDWSAALDTGFLPEDLSENPDLIIMMIKTKSSSLDLQKRQLALLQSSAEGDPATLKQEVETAAKALNTAEAALSSKYLDSTVQLAKIAIAVSTSGTSAAGEAVADQITKDAIQDNSKTSEGVEKDLAASVKKFDPEGTVDDVKLQIAAIDNAQRNLQRATSAWNSKKAALARAEATNTKTDQSFIESTISSLTLEIADLNARLTNAKLAREQRVAMATEKKDKLSVNDLAAKKPATGGGSRWQEINITHTHKIEEQSAQTEASASSSSWSVNFWLASGGGSSEKSTGSFKSKNSNKEVNLEISMKVTMVTVDRSSWFQPQLFDASKSFMKNNENMSFTQWPENTTAESIAASFRKSTRPAPLATSTLPAFPVGYILCKDVLIKVSNMEIDSSEEKTHLLEKSQSSGGFLCFSYNQASENSKDTSSAAFEMASDGMIVRIPGPQIIGYIQQVLPRDESIPYNPELSLGKEFYLPPTPSPDLGLNGDNKSGAGASGAAHGSKPPKNSNPYSAFKFDIARTSMNGTKDPTPEPLRSSTTAPPPPPPSGEPSKAAAPPTGDQKRQNAEELAGLILQKLLHADDGSLKDALAKALKA